MPLFESVLELQKEINDTFSKLKSIDFRFSKVLCILFLLPLWKLLLLSQSDLQEQVTLFGFQ